MAEIKAKNATDVLASYRRWKEQGESLKSQAQGFLVDRFHELVQEAQQVQQDLYEDFGYLAKFPSNPKHAKRSRQRAAQKKTMGAAKPAAGSATVASKAVAAQKATGGGANLKAPRDEQTRKLDSLTRQVERAKQRLEEAKAGGGPVKIQNAEDRLYELADELRLLQTSE